MTRRPLTQAAACSLAILVTATQAAAEPPVTTRMTAGDLSYLGAFALPEGDDWAYSGHALALYSSGDPGGAGDGFPGSLYTAAHAQQDLVGELSIPTPVVASSFEALPRATSLQDPADITGGMLDEAATSCSTCDRESWDIGGLLYLDEAGRVAWNLQDWFNVGGEDLESMGWSGLDMSNAQGRWHIGPRPNDDYPQVFHSNKSCDYLFRAPAGFASRHLEGRTVIAGHHRLSGSHGGSQGPSMIASAPWLDGNPPSPGQDLGATALVYYPWLLSCTDGEYETCHFPGYRTDDRWGGGAWIENGGTGAVLIAGLKGIGDSCYGDPGVECPEPACFPSRGWHSDPYEPQILFFDPAEIAEVVAGGREPWEVLPYEVYRPADHLMDPDCGLLAGVAYDSARQLVYVAEAEAGPDGETVVHVWQVLAQAPVPPVADFSWTPVSPTAGETVRFQDLSSGSPTSWSWSFGDGNAASTANPSHAFAEAGTYTVTLTASSDLGSDTDSEELVVRSSGGGPSVDDPGQYAWAVAASAKVEGVAGTNWLTDMVLNNEGADDASVTLFFLQRRLDNSDAIGVAATVPAGASLKIVDVVATSFGMADTAGAILIGSDSLLAITSRTYNDQGEAGTYGQFIPGTSLENALGTGETARVLQLTRSTRYRTNLGMVNLSGVPITVGVSLHSGAGTLLGDRSYGLEPWEYDQDDDLLGELDWNEDDAFAVVTTSTQGARLMVYGSIIDNVSGDPIFVPAMR